MVNPRAFDNLWQLIVLVGVSGDFSDGFYGIEVLTGSFLCFFIFIYKNKNKIKN